MKSYRIENGDDTVLWFAADAVYFDAEDELLKGYINSQHTFEYIVKTGDVLTNAQDQSIIKWESLP